MATILPLQRAEPIRVHLAGIEVVGNLDTTRSDHYVVIYLGRKEAACSDKMPRLPAFRWTWLVDMHFKVHISSSIKIVIIRENTVHGSTTEHLVAQYEGKTIELLENNASIDLRDESGAEIQSKLKIDLSLMFEPGERLRVIDAAIEVADAARLDHAGRVPTDILALEALHFTKCIMDVVANPQPILKAFRTILSAVYKSLSPEEPLDDIVRDLAETLRDMLCVAKDLPVLIGTINNSDIEEIGRISLKVTSLIYEGIINNHTKMSRTRGPNRARFQLTVEPLSDNTKSCIRQGLEICEDLKQKLNRRIDAYIQSPLTTIKNDELAKQIQNWFAAPDSSRKCNEARAKRQKNSCSWFLDGARFRELQEKPGFLWLKGTIGCGKTVLCSSIIDKIIEIQKENASVTYAYFFFDGRDSQNDLQLHNKLIRSLIWQLSLQCDGIPATLVDIYSRSHWQKLFTSSLEAVLHHIINGLGSTYIIIDSLSECTDQNQMLQWINQTVSVHMCNLRLVVASRPERGINSVLRPLDPYCIDLVDNSTNHDITMYIEQELQQVAEWDKAMRDVIKSALIERAQGMFLWVALQLAEMKKCSNHLSIRGQLGTHPKVLHELYDDIFLKTHLDDHTNMKKFLRSLCFSVRPMKSAEITETFAVYVDFDALGYDPYYRPPDDEYDWDVRDFIKKCAGLIIESDDGTMKLAHSSIKEYLLHPQHRGLIHGPWFLKPPPHLSPFYMTSDKFSHSLMAQTCLAYLLYLNNLDMVDENVAASFPFAPYAAEHWIFHAQSGDIDKPGASLTLELAKKLFIDQQDARLNWVRIWNLDNPHNTAMKYRDQSMIGPPLYYAALAGLEKLSLHLIEDEYADVNAEGGKYGTALQAASAKGHERIVKLLLRKGAEVDIHGGEHASALGAAVAGGYEGVVKLLLKKGADVNVEGGYYTTALRAAVAGGHEGIVELLLKKGADVNVEEGYYASALQLAAGGGNERITKLLLVNGADMEVSAGNHGNALQAAVAGGHEGIVKLLLEEGADVNAKGGYYGNALCAASAEGYQEIVELLLDKRADVNARGDEYGDALQAASAGGYNRIVKRLLEKGADVNAQGGEFGNALQAASAGGYDEIVRLLLEKGADVNRQGGKYGTALQAASAEGHKVTMKLLVEMGADIHILS